MIISDSQAIKFRILPFLISAAALLLLLAGFNWRVDPYYLMKADEIEGFNAKKPSFFFQLAKAKPYHFWLLDTDAVIVGSSRAGSAFDPSAPAIKGENYYNFATPGARIRQIDQALRSSVAGKGVVKLIVSLDFFGFNSHGDLPARSAEEYQRRLPQSGNPLCDSDFIGQALEDYSSALLSFDGLRDSLDTVKLQSEYAEQSLNVFTLYVDDGHWSPTFAKGRELYKAFQEAENTYLNNGWFPRGDPIYSLRPYEGYDPFAVYAQMLDFAYRHKVEIKVVLPPMHTRLLETLEYADLWGTLEQWKHLLVEINEKQAKNNKVQPYSIWDFITYSEITSESISLDTRTEDLRWVYDSSHVSKNAGDLILGIMHGGKNEGIGLSINSANIDNWLKETRERQWQFRKAFPSVAKEISQRVNKKRQKRNWRIELRDI